MYSKYKLVLSINLMKERMQRICLFHSISIRARGKHSSLSRLCTLSTFFFFFELDCTTFTLHDLTDFYVERVTAHRIKINYYSLAKLKTKQKCENSLGARRPPGVSGALCSLCILCKGRIGSAQGVSAEKCRDLCVYFCRNSSPNLTPVSKQGNSVYNLGKWVCFFKNRVMVLKFVLNNWL